MTGAVPCHEPEANEARSQPTPHRSNQSDNAAPCGYAALGWSASTWRLQIGLNNLPETTSTPATQPLSKRPLSVLRRRNRPVASDGTSITTKRSLGRLQESHSDLGAQRSNLPARVHHAVSAWILIQEAFDVSKLRPSLSNPNRKDCKSALIGWACDQARIGGRLKGPS